MVLYVVRTRTNTIIFTEFLFVELHGFLVLVGKKQDMRLVHGDKLDNLQIHVLAIIIIVH